MDLQDRVRRKLKHWKSLALDRGYRRQFQEDRRLAGLPRHTPTETVLFGKVIRVPDAFSFQIICREVFEKEIHRFRATTSTPYIIDGGSNIGLTIIYFKRLYPGSRVIGFEPDPAIYEALQHNLKSMGIDDVEIFRKALWNEDTTLTFMPDGADGGRVLGLDPARQKFAVEAVRLRDYLDRDVDYLKLDIEGAESAVLEDCADRLGRVRHLFVEYHSFIDQDQTLHALLAILHEAGFRVHLHPIVVAPQPFFQRVNNQGMDLQINVFAFRN
jgi:FkbM family methyltransferase